MRHWASLFIGLLLVSLSAGALARPVLTLGVFAFRPKPLMAHQYQPLIDYLGQQVPAAEFRLAVLTQDEMEQALTAGKLDLVFTNPSHFVVLRHMKQLTGAMATLVALEKGQPTSMLGGVILARADRNDIQWLADLREKRIAVPGVKYLGGYQTQAYEAMQTGIDLQNEASLRVMGSHDNVIQALLEGTVDVGFVRTGIIEAMTREGRLPNGRLKVINRQQPPDFPYAVSTRLYPEWAFAALPHVDQHIVRDIARALLRIEPDSPVAKAADIHGFIAPADYLPVENLARALRLPPFEGTPEFTEADIWARYQAHLLIALAGFAAVLALGLRLAAGNRRLHLAQTALRQTQASLSALLDNTPYLMWLKDADGRFLAVNRMFVASAGKQDASEIIGKTDFDLWPAELAERYRADDLEVMASGQQKLIEAEEIDRGRPRWMETYKTPIRDAGGHLLGTAGFARDISERRAREHRRMAEEMAHRDTLIREVHHRIKNNLQSVAALLRRALGAHAELDARLDVAITQVHTVAAVHGLQSGDPREISLLADMVEKIRVTVSQQTQRDIAWQPDRNARQAADLAVARDEAVAIALVINELMLNAVKHAPDDGPGPVVGLGRVAGGVELTIANRFRSRPSFDFATGFGCNTGLRLVRSLLPEEGAKLTHAANAEGQWVTTLLLSEPVIKTKEAT